MASQDSDTTETTLQETQVPNQEVFPPFDNTTYVSQLVWLAITFGVFYYIISKVALPRITDIIEQRKDVISNDETEASRLNQEAEEAKTAYETELEEAKKNAHEIARANREALNKEIAEKRKTEDAKLGEKLKEAESIIEAAKSKALTHIDDIATDTAQELINSLVGSTFQKEDVSKAVLESKS